MKKFGKLIPRNQKEKNRQIRYLQYRDFPFYIISKTILNF
ncbi:RecX family transcriptional regulator [Pantoea sp. SoEX]|nr:hypothetical protein [Pantoea sp. SoEX]